MAIGICLWWTKYVSFSKTAAILNFAPFFPSSQWPDTTCFKIAENLSERYIYFHKVSNYSLVLLGYIKLVNNFAEEAKSEICYLASWLNCPWSGRSFLNRAKFDLLVEFFGTPVKTGFDWFWREILAPFFIPWEASSNLSFSYWK